MTSKETDAMWRIGPEKPKALWLADVLETNIWDGICTSDERNKAAAELRRLHKEVEWIKHNMSNVSRVEQSLIAANERLHAVNTELLEACQTFVEWLRREDEGFVAAGKSRDTPEGEAEWREWFYGNLALCKLAQDQARAAIAKATGEQA